MNTRLSTLSSALVVALSLAGCAQFDPGSRVTSLRVLAVQADRPYAQPGETVHLDALSHDPQGRETTWAWATCVNPASALLEDCLAQLSVSAGAEAFQIGDSSSFD